MTSTVREKKKAHNVVERCSCDHACAFLEKAQSAYKNVLQYLGYKNQEKSRCGSC